MRLRFAEERLPAPGTIDPGMTDHHKEILFRKNARVRVGRLVGASGTGNVAGLALTERTGRVGASTYVIELEPGPAPLGQHMPRLLRGRGRRRQPDISDVKVFDFGIFNDQTVPGYFCPIEFVFPFLDLLKFSS